MTLPDLPIRPVLPQVADALAAGRPVVLQAPPGTGKTLLTAPYLLNAEWLRGRKIVLLEPRRLAARAAASQMARLLGEEVGRTVGYQIRLERRIGRDTRIEIVTGPRGEMVVRDFCLTANRIRFRLFIHLPRCQ